MRNELYSNTKVVVARAPAAITADVNTGNGVDVLGAEGATVIINTGAIDTAGKVNPVLTESDALDGVYTPVAAAQMDSDFPDPATGMAADSTYRASYLGFKRFIRPDFDHVSGTSIVAGAVVVLDHLRERPVGGNVVGGNPFEL